eukprot:TRINITY_DN58143_c0_g1_i1.p1 TRINITY_DN58143_c0_g1~~TRINITY_DN58143_c0_g1_i1.p1  ORF type:complete len:479 (-),score=57.32 TRINITY_DN58143_c0_g1_i1:231-1667(-)
MDFALWKEIGYGCRLCEDAPVQVKDVFFGDVLGCLSATPFNATSDLVSCTLPACFMIDIVCNSRSMWSGANVSEVAMVYPQVHDFLLHWSTHFAYDYLRVLAELRTGIAHKMMGLFERTVERIHACSNKYGSVLSVVKPNSDVADKLPLLEEMLRVRRLFQWHYNYLIDPCTWSFMEQCRFIEFERDFPRFDRFRVVADLLLSYHDTKLRSSARSASASRPGDPNSHQFSGMSAGRRNTYLDIEKYDYVNDKRFNDVGDQMPQAVAGPPNAGNTTVRFVELGVFQGRLAFHVLRMCPFLEYIGVDPYSFENDDYEFQGLFTDAINDGLVEGSGASPRSSQSETSANVAGDRLRFFKNGMHEAREGARVKIRLFANRAQLWEVRSEVAAQRVPDGTVDMVFVDADHSYAATLKDIKLWYPKLRRGGVMGGHDFGSNQEVTRAVMEFRAQLDAQAGSASKGFLPTIIRVDADWTWHFIKY